MAQVKPVNKKKMSGPSIAALIVTIAILIGLVVSLLAGSGLFVRVQKGASSENYEINGSMMSYYVNSFYQSWYSNYYYYILLGYISFNPNLPFDQQYTDSNKTQTYYDYFKEGATVNVTKILKYCEAARVDSEINFAELEQEAKTYAADTIKSLKATAKANGYDFNTFVRQNFGQYVSENDLKNAIVLEYIANDYSNTLYDRIYDAMTDERKEQFFKDNLATYISADYLTFSLSQTVTPEKVDEKLWVLGETLIQQFIGACVCRQAKDGKQRCRGIFITTSRFTPEAKAVLESVSEQIIGYDGTDLFEAAKECQFGIIKRNGEWVLDENLLSSGKVFFTMF